MSSEKYVWRAVYNDGTSLDQIGPDGISSKYTDIDRANLDKFLLIETETEKPKIILHLKPGQKLIHRRRVSHRMPLSAIFFEENPDRPTIETVWIVGWHENRRGVNVQMLLFLFEDGTVEFLDRWREDHVLYTPVILLPEEKLENEV